MKSLAATRCPGRFLPAGDRRFLLPRFAHMARVRSNHATRDVERDREVHGPCLLTPRLAHMTLVPPLPGASSPRVRLSLRSLRPEPSGRRRRGARRKSSRKQIGRFAFVALPCCRSPNLWRPHARAQLPAPSRHVPARVDSTRTRCGRKGARELTPMRQLSRRKWRRDMMKKTRTSCHPMPRISSCRRK